MATRKELEIAMAQAIRDLKNLETQLQENYDAIQVLNKQFTSGQISISGYQSKAKGISAGINQTQAQIADQKFKIIEIQNLIDALPPLPQPDPIPGPEEPTEGLSNIQKAGIITGVAAAAVGIGIYLVKKK